MADRIGLLIATALCGVIAAAPVSAQTSNGKPVYMGTKATPEEITNAFLMGGGASNPQKIQEHEELPPGLMPDESQPLAPGAHKGGVLIPPNPTPPSSSVTPASLASSPAPASQLVPAAQPVATAQPATTGGGCPTNTNVLAFQITFKLNSARLQDDMRETVENIATSMNGPQLKKCRFIVEGHTDSRGTDKINEELSERRAIEVRKILVTNNVALDRLITVGKAARDPYNPANPRADENRRVQFRIIP